MLKVLAIFMMLAIFSADYTPNWKSCSDPSDSWHPTSVTLNAPPVHGQVSTLDICGESVDNFTMNAFTFKVKVLNIVIDSGTRPVRPPVVATAGVINCTIFNMTIPSFLIGTIDAQIWGLDTDGNERGCLQFDITV